MSILASLFFIGLVFLFYQQYSKDKFEYDDMDTMTDDEIMVANISPVKWSKTDYSQPTGFLRCDDGAKNLVVIDKNKITQKTILDVAKTKFNIYLFNDVKTYYEYQTRSDITPHIIFLSDQEIYVGDKTIKSLLKKINIEPIYYLMSMDKKFSSQFEYILPKPINTEQIELLLKNTDF